MSARNWLPCYQSQFSTVELNASFYRLPREATVKGWGTRAPAGFSFAVKGSRYTTHVRRLKNCEEPLALFTSRMAGLGAAMGPVLWQLPPNLHRDDGLLRDFLARLPSEYRHAVEFRHPSWFHDDVAEILDEQNIAMVSVSSLIMPAAKWVTGGMIYLRFHGLAGGFSHDYTDAELAPWVRWTGDSLANGARAFVFFNNDGEARAPENAHRFLELLRCR